MGQRGPFVEAGNQPEKGESEKPEKKKMRGLICTFTGANATQSEINASFSTDIKKNASTWAKIRC
jgi:hypothetical protein